MTTCKIEVKFRSATLYRRLDRYAAAKGLDLDQFLVFAAAAYATKYPLRRTQKAKNVKLCGKTGKTQGRYSRKPISSIPKE